MLNNFNVIGRLGHDPRVNTSKSGTTVCSFSIANDTGYGERKQTDWFAVTCFGKTAENANRYLRKGSLVCLTGEVHVKSYQGKDGTQKTAVEIVASQVNFLDPKQDGQQAAPNPAPTQPMANQSSPDYFSDIPVANEELPF